MLQGVRGRYVTPHMVNAPSFTCIPVHRSSSSAKLHSSLALVLTECQGSHIRSGMPTYEYGCPACGHQWEEVQRITEPASEKCPKCGELKAHRLISGGTNFILKGGGWYSDLYSSAKSSSKNSDSNSGSSSDTDAKPAPSETKTETKTEAKTETKPSTPPASSSSGTREP